MPFVVDSGSGFGDFGREAGAFMEAFTGARQKQALVEAEAARSAAYQQAVKLQAQSQALQRQRQAMADRAAQDLMRFSATWMGPDAGFAGVDANGNPSTIDQVRRRKMHAMTQIAKNMPFEMAQEFMAVQQRELEEEILQSARERLQDKLANLQGRLAQDLFGDGQGDLYKQEIEETIEALNDPFSDPGEAEAVYQRLQGLVEAQTIQRDAYRTAGQQIDSFLQDTATSGRSTETLSSIKAKLQSGAMTPREARDAAVRSFFDMGPMKYSPPGVKGEFDIHSRLFSGGGSHIDQAGQAEKAEAWMLGVAMAREDPDLDNLDENALFKRASAYATNFLRMGDWYVPDGWVHPEGPQPAGAPPPDRQAAIQDLARRYQAGEFGPVGDPATDEALAEAARAAGLDPDEMVGGGGGAAPSTPSGHARAAQLVPQMRGRAQSAAPPAAPQAQQAAPSPERAMELDSEIARNRVEVEGMVERLTYDQLIKLVKDFGMTGNDYKQPSHFDPYTTAHSTWGRRGPAGPGEKAHILAADPKPREIAAYLDKLVKDLDEAGRESVNGQRLIQLAESFRSSLPRFEELQKLRSTRVTIERLGYAGPEDPAAMEAWLQEQIGVMREANPTGIPGDQQGRFRALNKALDALQKMLGTTPSKALRSRAGGG